MCLNSLQLHRPLQVLIQERKTVTGMNSVMNSVMNRAYLLCHTFCALASRLMNTAPHHLQVQHLRISSLFLWNYVGQRLLKSLASAI